MDKDPKVYLDHVLESIALLAEYTADKTKDEFIHSIEFQDRVVRRLTIIGEAMRNLPMSLRKKHPSIPWRKIVGMRDILIHEYFGIDLDLTWQAATVDVRKLKRQIIKLKEYLR